MGTVRFTKGDKVVTPTGDAGTVRKVETISTGKRGRPPTEVTVKTKAGVEVYSPTQLSFAV